MRRNLSLALAQESQVMVSNMPTGDVADLADEQAMAKSQDELDTDIVAIDEAAEVVGALEELAESLHGAGPAGVQIAQITHEHLGARVGLHIAQEAAFGAGAGFFLSADIESTFESIKATAKRVWKAIVEALKKAWRWLKLHAQRIFDFSGRAVKRAEALVAKVKTLSAGEPKAATIKDAKIATALAINGEIPKNLSLEVAKTTTVLGSFLLKAHNAHLFDETRLKHLTDGRAEFSFSASEVQYGHGVSKPVDEKSSEVKIPESLKHTLQLVGSDVLLGGDRVVMIVPKQAVEGFQAVRALTMATPQIERAHAASKHGGEMPVAKLEQLGKICASALELAKGVAEFRSVIMELDKMADKLIKAAEGHLGNDTHKNGQPTGDLAEQQKWQRAYLSSAPRWLVDEPMKIASYALLKANTLISFGERCAAQYTAKA